MIKFINKDKQRQTHRGAKANKELFAEKSLQGRTAGFKKDIEICTKGYLVHGNKGKTHAYIPALINCISYLEYMASLYTGSLQGLTAQSKVNQYSSEEIRILYKIFRNPIAHRGIPSGVVIDQKDNVKRRITWKIYVRTEKSAISVQKENGILQLDPPWDVPFNYR